MIILAWAYPTLGNYQGTWSLDNITSIGISFIFFFYGLKLSPKQMMKGVSNYHLHLATQLTTFVLFPLLVIMTRPFISSPNSELIWLSIFFLAALPSTVSSSVVMVSIARGNVPAAIFNASLSGILGIFITPFWMGLFMSGGDTPFDFYSILIKLFVSILLPVIMGLLLNKALGGWAKKHSSKLTLFDKTIILTIVYNSFSKSFLSGLFTSIGVMDLLLIGVAVMILFGITYFILDKISTLFQFKEEDKITALFCGSKKSLVHGSVMAKVLFGNMASQGIFLVPVMIYHAMQLIVISFIAQRKAKRLGDK